MTSIKDYIKINLQDHDGLVIENTTYKLANGQPIHIFCKGYPMIRYENYLSPSENLHTKVDVNSTLSFVLGPAKFSGNQRPVITLTVVIPISTSILENTEYANLTSPTILSYYLLYNMWRYPHKMYLKDSLDETQIKDVDYPINILINKKDLLGQTIFDSKGMPVILKSISPSGEGYVNHSDVLKSEGYFEYTLEFYMDA